MSVDGPLWAPSAERAAGTLLAEFARFVGARGAPVLDSYAALHALACSRDLEELRT